MKVKKFGTIIENDKGDLQLSNFIVDCEGEDANGTTRCVIELVIKRFQDELDKLTGKQNEPHV